MERPVHQCPCDACRAGTGPDADALLRLHEILLTACESDRADRYPSASAMQADLLEVQRTFTPNSASIA